MIGAKVVILDGSSDGHTGCNVTFDNVRGRAFADFAGERVFLALKSNKGNWFLEFMDLSKVVWNEDSQ